MPNQVRHNAEAPPVAQAAQVALVVMSIAKASDWAGVLASPKLSSVSLSPAQQALLEAHRGILPYLSKKPLRSVVACPECGRFMFTAGSRAVSKRCTMSLGCPGTPVKARSTQEPAR